MIIAGMLKLQMWVSQICFSPLFFSFFFLKNQDNSCRKEGNWYLKLYVSSFVLNGLFTSILDHLLPLKPGTWQTLYL